MSKKVPLLEEVLKYKKENNKSEAYFLEGGQFWKQKNAT